MSRSQLEHALSDAGRKRSWRNHFLPRKREDQAPALIPGCRAYRLFRIDEQAGIGTPLIDGQLQGPGGVDQRIDQIRGRLIRRL